jgi:hypothetical protein
VDADKLSPGDLVSSFTDTQDLLLAPRIEFREENKWTWGDADVVPVKAGLYVVIALLDRRYGWQTGSYGTHRTNEMMPVYVVTPHGVGWLSTDEVTDVF